MESELDQELLRQVADRLDEVTEKRSWARLIQTGVKAETGKRVRRRQVWHYLIPVFAAFWLIFAIILIASGFLFLAAALATLVLLSSLVIGLAWAFQNDI